MGNRRFNYTERRRIRHEDVAIRLGGTAEAPTFDATMELSAYQLPDTAGVFVEAYRQTSARRFSFGKAGKVVAPADRSLRGMPDPGSLLFRVKVVELENGRGRLLAEADQLKALEPEGGGRRSLVDVREADLAGELWHLSLESERPMLLVERRYGPREMILSMPHFRWLVLPQVLRDLLRRAIRDGAHEDDDPIPTDWRTQVMTQAEGLAGECPSGDLQDDDVTNWITSVVRAFCRKHGFAQRHATAIFGGGE